MLVGRQGFRGRNIWRDMLRRCDNPARAGYENYGGRGISYDPLWKSFDKFWEDMGAGYTEQGTLERDDVNGNYELSNCRWVTLAEQMRNKRGYKSNALGVANCMVFEGRGIPYLRARITDPEGKRVCKVQSLYVRPLEEALIIAQEWLATKRIEFGYGEGHGS